MCVLRLIMCVFVSLDGGEDDWVCAIKVGQHVHVYVCKSKYILSAYIHFHSQKGVSGTKSHLSML